MLEDSIAKIAMTEFEGDLRDTGMSLKHDRKWSYEIDRIQETVDDKNADSVGLQFPQGLKRKSTDVVSDLRSRMPDVEFYISGQPCYGACDIDKELFRFIDLMVHFGHTPMQESPKIVYVPLFSNVEVMPIIRESLSEISDEEPVCLVTTAQHMNKFDDMKNFLNEEGFDVKTQRGSERLSKEGQVLGCNYASADVSAPQVLYVGGGEFHPMGLAMSHRDKKVVIADPVNNIVKIADPERFIKKRYAAIHEALDAEEFGIIYCTKIGQGRIEEARNIVNENESAYLITLDEVTPDRLRQFDVDAFVNTGCPRITTDDADRFSKPLLTPNEYRIAIGEKDMDELSFDTFHGTWSR
jgi:2-(3-amino-3-carboxypropyl)histidine synthase